MLLINEILKKFYLSIIIALFALLVASSIGNVFQSFSNGKLKQKNLDLKSEFTVKIDQMNLQFNKDKLELERKADDIESQFKSSVNEFNIQLQDKQNEIDNLDRANDSSTTSLLRTARNKSTSAVSLCSNSGKSGTSTGVSDEQRSADRAIYNAIEMAEDLARFSTGLATDYNRLKLGCSKLENWSDRAYELSSSN